MTPLQRMSSTRLAWLLGAGGLLVLLAVGVFIGATVVWIPIAIPMTAIVLVLLADYERTREGRSVAAVDPRQHAAERSSRAH